MSKMTNNEEIQLDQKMMNIQEYVWKILTTWGLPQKLTIR